MKQLLKGICYTIHGYVSEAQARKDYLEGLITDARNGYYDEEALKAYEEEYVRLEDEISRLLALADEISSL